MVGLRVPSGMVSERRWGSPRDMQKREPSSPKTLIVYTSTCMYAACRCYILHDCVPVCLPICLDGCLFGWTDGWMYVCINIPGLKAWSSGFLPAYTQTLVQQRSTSKSRLPYAGQRRNSGAFLYSSIECKLMTVSGICREGGAGMCPY